jgi:MFS family permease
LKFIFPGVHWWLVGTREVDISRRVWYKAKLPPKALDRVFLPRGFFISAGEQLLLSAMKKVSNIYAISAFAAIGGGLFGFDISSMSGVLATQAYINYFNNPLGYRQGGITCAMPAGSLVGALASSFISDKWGRKIAIQIGAVIWIIGAM